MSSLTLPREAAENIMNNDFPFLKKRQCTEIV